MRYPGPLTYLLTYLLTYFTYLLTQCIATLPPSLAGSGAEVARLSPYLWTHPYTALSRGTCHVLDDGAVVGYCIGCPDVRAFVAAYGAYASAGGGGVLARDVRPPPRLDAPEPFWIPVDGEGEGEGDGGGKKTRKSVVANPTALAQLAYRADWMLLGSDAAAVDADADADADDDDDDDDDDDKVATTGIGSRAELTRRWRATMHIDLLEGWRGRGWGRLLVEAFARSVRRSGADYGRGVHIGVAADNRQVVGFYKRLGFRVVRVGGGGSGDDGGEGSVTMVKDIERP